ncbi:MAG: hypothetical protein QW304_08450 [Thermoproteota archaeon]
MVIDFGVGESTKKLSGLGAKVIVVDRDLEKLKTYRSLGTSLIDCNIANLPFRSEIAGLAVFYFTLHEIDPRIHKEAISKVREASSGIMVVEPSPKGCSTYNRYAELWRRAMHSIGKFEDYQPASYWKRLVEDCGFRVIVLKKVKQTTNIIPRVLEEIVQSTIEEWRKMSVKEKYVREMNKFLEYAKKNGMRWSDLIVIIGESS